jgi:hypothetical protein
MVRLDLDGLCYDCRSPGTPRLRIDLYGYSGLAPQGDPILSYVIMVVLLYYGAGIVRRSLSTSPGPARQYSVWIPTIGLSGPLGLPRHQCPSRAEFPRCPRGTPGPRYPDF